MAVNVLSQKWHHLGKSKSWLQGFAQQKVSLPEGKLKAREAKNNEKQRKTTKNNERDSWA